MPMHRERYPADWPDISRRIRFERAKGRCECPGVNVCGTDHGGRCEERNGRDAITFRGRVVLTCAHLDNDTTRNTDDNLLALCQQCHLRLDAAFHAANARLTRERKSGQARLL
jgi:hypothetical protein